MTYEETKAILSVLKAGYPNFYKDLKPTDANDIINLWSTMFADDSSKVVTEAVKSLMCTLKFPPTIADVKEKIALIIQPVVITEMEAWSKVLKAIQNSNYQSQECFDNLPSTIQKIIGSPNQLREWAMTEDLNLEVVSSNFMRSYMARVKAEKEYKSLPESTKKMMLEVTERAALTDGSS